SFSPAPRQALRAMRSRRPLPWASSLCGGSRKAWRANWRRKEFMSVTSLWTAAFAVKAGRFRQTSRIVCSIPTLSRRPISTSCGSRAALGHGRSNCDHGSRSSDANLDGPVLRKASEDTRMTNRTTAKVILVIVAVLAAATANAQSRHRREREPKETERPAPAASVDKRDTVVNLPGGYNGKPYWLALAQCGGAYFKLNVLYTAIAVQARAVKPDPKLNTEYTRKLNDAIKTATAFYSGAERFLMSDRGIERVDAVLIYNEQSRLVSDRIKTIDPPLRPPKTTPPSY